ncbi:MAG: MFS transporter, partial [Dehalococcoidales bacterium]|nr:MFS transporter [Dehalococcoidales bacterium]
FIPAATGIVADEFPRSRQQAIGLLTSILPIGWVVGPNLGGWMTVALGWRSIFWINIPLCAVALVASALLLPGGVRRESRIDLVGAGLLACGLGGIMIGISEMGSADSQPMWALTGLLLGAGVASLVYFWRRQNRVKDPVIEPEVLRGRPFVAANVYNLMFGAVMGALSLIPLYAVSIYGMSTIESGLIITPRSVVMLGASTVTSFLLVRWGYRWPMSLGVAGTVPGLVLLALEPASFGILGSSLMFLLLVMGLFGLSQGMATPASNNACIELMPQHLGTIVALRVMVRQTGGILSITTCSLLLENLGVAPGFRLFFFAYLAFMIVITPAIFAMPKSCQPPQYSRS